MNTIIAIMTFLIILMILCYFLIKNDNFCDNLNSLKSLYNDSNSKIYYIKLHKSNTNKKLFYLLKLKHQHIFSEEVFFVNKDYLLTLSKFIDYKINNNNKLYRSKNNWTIIENLTYILVQSIHQNNTYQIFKTYKNNYLAFSIKQKENKLFKFLVGKCLIEELYKIEYEMIKISLIIYKYKKRKFILNYKKSIYNTAKYYSIFKYNPNSNKLLYDCNINKKSIIDSLFFEMNDAKRKLKTIISYLKVMF